MDVYKAKIQYDGSLDKLNLIIVVRGDMQKKELVGNTWPTTASMRTLKYLLVNAVKKKARVHQLYLIGEILQAKVKNKLFMRFDSRCAKYFPKYSNYFGKSLRLLKSIYYMTKSGKLFGDEFTEWSLETGFIQSQCQMSIYYKYAPDGTKISDLSYIDDCVYWYNSEAPRKWFVEDLGKIFHVNVLVNAHWFTSIKISHMNDHSISVDQARYVTFIVVK